ncbi:hypothetical protein B0H14DRAFT_2655498 [Mycena olivaceomarginata]|nr:hypothetical protein B0H14DRAFT_2655498 [Mycena olivaceomarginata]
MRTLFAVNQWLCNIFSLAPPTISRPPLAQYFPFSCDASAGRLPPSTTPLSARFRTDFAVNPSAESITHFEWLRTSALAASVSGAFLSPISLPRRLRNVFACMRAIEAGSALTVAEAPALKATAVLRNFRGFRRRAPRMGTAWGCAHGCEAAASLPRERWYELRVPYTFPPRYRTRAHSAAAGNCPPPTRSAVPVAVQAPRRSPAPACRPTPALEQGGGRTRAPRQPSSLRPPARLPARPPARPPALLRANPRFRKCAREDLACGWLEVYPAGREGWRRSWAYGIYPHRCARPRFRKCGRERRVETAGGTRGHEDLACRRDRGYPAGREGWCRAWAYGIYPPRCARAPDFENAGGNGGWKRRAGHVRAKI